MEIITNWTVRYWSIGWIGGMTSRIVLAWHAATDQNGRTIAIWRL